ncbi:hypothetical protein VKT23_005781 [Stygiomarasmius scandens]|uniref:Uncharacterized protein n=1 Tax=Marasmiellus scandens TaxID=2682957 RepID=A0ABR1JWX2_9AGAR
MGSPPTPPPTPSPTRLPNRSQVESALSSYCDPHVKRNYNNRQHTSSKRVKRSLKKSQGIRFQGLSGFYQT